MWSVVFAYICLYTCILATHTSYAVANAHTWCTYLCVLMTHVLYEAYLWWTFFLSAMILAMLPNTLTKSKYGHSIGRYAFREFTNKEGKVEV